jgi:hypothetical protein
MGKLAVSCVPLKLKSLKTLPEIWADSDGMAQNASSTNVEKRIAFFIDIVFKFK